MLEGYQRRVANIAAELRDKFELRRKAEIVDVSSRADAWGEAFFDEETVQRVLGEVAALPDGNYVYNFGAGKTHTFGPLNENSRHAHAFHIEKDSEATRIYFLDPEYRVGNKSLLRPSTVNIAAIERSGDKLVRTILRADTGPLPERVSGDFIQGEASYDDMEMHLIFAMQLLKGDIPAAYRAHMEDVGFYFYDDGTKAAIASGYHAKSALEQMDPEHLDATLAGKAENNTIILERMARDLKDGRFRLQQEP